MWQLKLRESYPSYQCQGHDIISHVTGNKRCFNSLLEQASINSKADNMPWWSLERAIWKLPVYIWH